MKPDLKTKHYLKVGDIMFFNQKYSGKHGKGHFHIVLQIFGTDKNGPITLKYFSSYNGKLVKCTYGISLSELSHISEGFWEHPFIGIS